MGEKRQKTLRIQNIKQRGEGRVKETFQLISHYLLTYFGLLFVLFKLQYQLIYICQKNL